MSSEPTQDWYLREWLLHLGKRQASLVNELGWDKSKANFIWHGKQPYRRDVVNEVAAWLELQPFELLMRPEEALRLRQMREAAMAIAANEATGPQLEAADRERAFRHNAPTPPERHRPIPRKKAS